MMTNDTPNVTTSVIYHEIATLCCCDFQYVCFRPSFVYPTLIVRREWWRQGFQKLRDRAREHFLIWVQPVFLPLQVLGWTARRIDTPRLEDSAAVCNLPYFDGDPIRFGGVRIPDLTEAR